MIISASRRTDIPAFYSEWFLNRLEEDYVLVRNPMNYNQVSRVMLTSQKVDCIVFWTKNPANMLDKLCRLSEYKYYFLITITGYGDAIERNVPNKDVVVESFRALSERIGSEKTVWRYDPIILTDTIDTKYHCRNFHKLACELAGYTEKCIISFVDIYKKCRRNMEGLNVIPFDAYKMTEVAARLSEIAAVYDIKMETCCEAVDLTSIGIQKGKCIDAGLISRITGQNIKIQKDKNQRDLCGCAASIDIGAYNTCKHGCLYCYANFSDKTVARNALNHHSKSPLLVGELKPGDRVTERF